MNRPFAGELRHTSLKEKQGKTRKEQKNGKWNQERSCNVEEKNEKKQTIMIFNTKEWYKFFN